MNPNRNISRHIIIKITKFKEGILKAAREKQRVIYKGILIRLSTDLFAETLQARRDWHDIFKLFKGKTGKPKILYPTRLSFRIEGVQLLAPTKKLHLWSLEGCCTDSNGSRGVGGMDAAQSVERLGHAGPGLWLVTSRQSRLQ